MPEVSTRKGPAGACARAPVVPSWMYMYGVPAVESIRRSPDAVPVSCTRTCGVPIWVCVVPG